MNNPEFVYTIYIKTTREKLWAALTNPEFTRQYWGGGENVSDWKKGSEWRHFSDVTHSTVSMAGEVVESVPPKYLVLTWTDPADPADVSRVTFELEPMEDMVCLNVIHGDFIPGSSMVGKVSWGWPRVLSSLKSLLETGTGINVWAGGHGNCAKSAEAREAV
jgi:uncharacterized protein YndB with AHSA1/START domain